MPSKSPPTLAKLFRRAADTDRAFATAVEASQVGKFSDHVARTLDQATGEEMDKIAAGAELPRSASNVPAPAARGILEDMDRQEREARTPS